jgi:hypothetical protein
MFLLYNFFEINYVTLCIPFDYFFKKCNLDTCIVSLKDSKLRLHSLQIILKYFYYFKNTSFFYWYTTIHYNYNNVSLKNLELSFVVL